MWRNALLDGHRLAVGRGLVLHDLAVTLCVRYGN